MIIYNRVNRLPITIARLMRDEILVTPYRMPEKVGSLYTPSADNKTAQFGKDKTQTLWEVLLGNVKADEVMGMHIPIGAIVQTVRRFPRDSGCETDDGRSVHMLSVEDCGVRGIITYTDKEEDV